MTTQPRTWTLYAHDYGALEDKVRFAHVFADEKHTARYSARQPVVKVTVTEDDNGTHMGWIATDTVIPTHIVRAGIFDIQFPDGHKNREARGFGKAVRLSIELAA